MPPQLGSPEDLNNDVWVDDLDLAEVITYFGAAQWLYEYDLWGSLTKAVSACAGTYEAKYDGMGRRVWQQVAPTGESAVQTYFVYDGDTIIGELDANGNLIAEYTWGQMGPIMMRRYDFVSQTWYTYYYVQDILGHTRRLLDGQGNVTDERVYYYSCRCLDSRLFELTAWKLVGKMPTLRTRGLSSAVFNRTASTTVILEGV
jgi:hypothetical protein